jgi:hypothetical protein
VNLCFDVSVLQLWLECHKLRIFLLQNVCTISDYDSATSPGRTVRMNNMIYYLVLESNNRFFSEKLF